MVPHPEKCKAMIMQWKSTFTGPIQALRLANNIIKWTTSERLLGVQVALVRSCCKCSEVLRIQVKSTLTHAIPPSEAIRRFLHKSDTAISYIRSDSVGIVQQHAPKKPGKPPCKGWMDGLPWNTSAEDVLMRTGWDSLETMYKVRLLSSSV